MEILIYNVINWFIVAMFGGKKQPTHNFFFFGSVTANRVIHTRWIVNVPAEIAISKLCWV